MKGLAITGVVAGPAGIDSLEVFVNYYYTAMNSWLVLCSFSRHCLLYLYFSYS